MTAGEQPGLTAEQARALDFERRDVPHEVFLRVLGEAMETLATAGIRFAVFGGFASAIYGRERTTTDVDFFIRPEDAQPALEALAAAGFDTLEYDEEWLYKAMKEGVLVDLIFMAKGGIYMDPEMLDRARDEAFDGVPLKVLAPEDLVVMKATAHSEPTERYWHDAVSMLGATRLDWDYLVSRGRRWAPRVLSLLFYAQSEGIEIPTAPLQALFDVAVGRAPAAPATGPNVPKHYVVSRVREVLAADDRVNELNVNVTVAGRKVVLTGNVSSPERREAITVVVRELLPDHEVHNHTTCVRIEEPTEAETV